MDALPVGAKREASHNCYEVTFVKWTEKFSQQLKSRASRDLVPELPFYYAAGTQQ